MSTIYLPKHFHEPHAARDVAVFLPAAGFADSCMVYSFTSSLPKNIHPKGFFSKHLDSSSIVFVIILWSKPNRSNTHPPTWTRWILLPIYWVMHQPPILLPVTGKWKPSCQRMGTSQQPHWTKLEKKIPNKAVSVRLVCPRLLVSWLRKCASVHEFSSSLYERGGWEGSCAPQVN